MNYVGGDNRRVSSQPPQRTSQCATAARSSSTRVSSSALFSRSLTTFGGSPERVSRRTIFFTQGITAHPTAGTPRRPMGNRNGKAGGSKAPLSHCSAFPQDEWLTEPRRMKASRAGARTGRGALAPRRSPAFFPLSRKARLARPLCCSISVLLGKSPEGAGRNLVRLPGGLDVAASGGLRKPVQAPVHHFSPFEAHGDDLGHVLFSKSSKPARPALTSNQ